MEYEEDRRLHVGGGPLFWVGENCIKTIRNHQCCAEHSRGVEMFTPTSRRFIIGILHILILCIGISLFLFSCLAADSGSVANPGPMLLLASCSLFRLVMSCRHFLVDGWWLSSTREVCNRKTIGLGLGGTWLAAAILGGLVVNYGY